MNHYFTLLARTDGDLVAVRYGFNYPAFFFSWAWALWKRMSGVAGLVILVSLFPFGLFLLGSPFLQVAVHPLLYLNTLVAIGSLLLSEIFPPYKILMALPPLLFVPTHRLSLLSFLVLSGSMTIGWGTAVFLGFRGNSLLEQKYTAQGYHRIPGFFRAKSAEDARQQYLAGTSSMLEIPHPFSVWRWGNLWSILLLWPYVNTVFAAQIWGGHRLF
jgi:hypothetical protein